MEADVINAALQNIWADEVEIVGPSTARDIADNAGNVDILSRTEGGHNFDAEQAARILVEAATFLKISLEIYQLALKGPNADKQSDEQLEKNVLADSRVSKLSKEIRGRVMEVVKFMRR